MNIPKPSDIDKILIIQTAFTGDVVLATPVIERLYRCYPGAEIHFLLRKGNEALLDGHPFVRKVLLRDKKLGKMKSLLKVIREMRAERYDLVVNLHRFGSSGLVAWLTGAWHISGFDKNPFAWAYHKKVPHQIGEAAGAVHEVDRNLSVIAHLTQGPADPMRLYPSEADWTAAKQEAPYVCIAPTSVWFTKQWPEKKWVELMDNLPRGLQVYLLGGPGDAEACQRIADASVHRRTRVMAGELSYLRSAALMSGARMNFVNDSAPLHFASAMDAPVTAVFCSTIPAFGFGPRGKFGKVVETELALDCKPCGLHGHAACPKGHFKCAEIKVERLLQGWTEGLGY